MTPSVPISVTCLEKTKLEDAVTKGIRNLFNSVRICVGIAIVAMCAAMLVDSSPAFPQQNVLATAEAHSGLAGAVNRPTGVAANPSISWLRIMASCP